MSQQSMSHKQGRYVEYDNQPGKLRYGVDAAAGSAAQAAVEERFGSTQVWLQDSLSEITQKVNTDPATTTVSVNVTGDEIQDAIDASSPGDIIEVTNAGPYNPIVFPTHELTIRSTNDTQISGAQCVSFPDGAQNQILSGFEFPSGGYSTPAPNNTGAAISFVTNQCKLDKVIIHDCEFQEISGNGSAVMMCYHWTVGGDNYAAQQLLSENSDRMAFIDCRFTQAAKGAGVEGGALTLRGFNNAVVLGCQLDQVGENPRGIQLLNCVDLLVLNNECSNIGPGIGNGEGIKLDKFGSPDPSFRTTGRIEGNICHDCIEGIDADDFTDVLIINNLCYDNIDEGISVDDTGIADVVKNECRGNANGIRYESGSSGVYYGNRCYANTSNNYLIQSDYVENADVWLLGVEPL